MNEGREITITVAITASRKSAFVTGSILNGWSALETNEAHTGDQIVGPFSEKAFISSRSPAMFSGPLYNIWTESISYKDDGSIDEDSCEHLFDAVTFGADNKYFKIVKDARTGRMMAEPTLISDLVKGDIVLSLPGYLPNTQKFSERISFAGRQSKAVIARISKIDSKNLVNAPAISLTFKNAYGILIDGIAVTKL